MYKEEMTPLERAIAFSKGEEIDRIMIVPDMGVTMSEFIGATTSEYYTNADVIVETEVALFNRLRHDSVGVSTTLRGMAEAMGSEIYYPRDNISSLKNPIVKKVEDIEKLKIIDPTKDGKLPILLDALLKLREKIGSQVDVGASMTGPFSVCASVIGTETMLRWMVKKKEELHKVMQICTLNNEQYIKTLASLGFTTSFCDPVASTSLIKYSQFQEFALPYIKQNIQHCHKYMKSKPTVHICGKSKELWKDIADAGCGNWSIDNCEDLSLAKEIVGNQCVITGNVPPVDVVMMGSKDDIFKSVKECIEKGKDSPKGYILSTGCQIPKGTPIENIEYFMEAGKLFGSLK